MAKRADARDTIDTPPCHEGGQRFMMPVRQLARLNFGTPRESRELFAAAVVLSLRCLSCRRRRTRDKGERGTATGEKKREEKRRERRGADEIAAGGRPSRLVVREGAELIRQTFLPRVRVSVSVHAGTRTSPENSFHLGRDNGVIIAISELPAADAFSCDRLRVQKS